MLLAHKIELRPTPEQVIYLNQAFGCKRHCYNQLLAYFSQVKWSKQEAYLKYKEIRAEFTFYKEVSNRVTRNTIDDLDNAFQHFFRRVKKKEKAGFPVFKKKDVRESFALRESEKFSVFGRELRIEKLKTRIKMRQELRFEGRPKQVTISKQAGKYFVSILVETQSYNLKKTDKDKSVGMDLGVKHLATLSNGQCFKANQMLKNNLKKLAKQQRNLSRQKKGSNRRARAKLKVATLHYRIRNQRQAVLHEFTDYLTRTFDRIVIEDLNVKGMVRNRKLSRCISDAGFGEFRRQLDYKTQLRGNDLVIADRFFPSSKTCSHCSHLKSDLSERVFDCENCGVSLHRDFNASLNLNQYSAETPKPTLTHTRDEIRPVHTGIVVDRVNESSQL